jgi:hypothetical protein
LGSPGIGLRAALFASEIIQVPFTMLPVVGVSRPGARP